MCMFYRSHIDSLLSFYLLCWFNSLNVKNKNCLQRIVNQGSKITGKQMTMAQLYHMALLHCMIRIGLAHYGSVCVCTLVYYCLRVGGIIHM